MIGLDYVSADGHVVEPADLWVSRMDKRFRDRAPRIESGPDGDSYVIDGLIPFQLVSKGKLGSVAKLVEK